MFWSGGKKVPPDWKLETMGPRTSVRDSVLKQAIIIVASAAILLVVARTSIYGWANTLGYARAAFDTTKYALLSPHLKQIEQLTNRIAVNPAPNQENERSNLFMQRAFDYMLLGMTEKAFADMSSAIALNPDDPVAYTARAGLSVCRGRDKDAIDDFGAAIRNDSSGYDVGSYLSRAAAYVRLHNYVQAVEDYNAVVRLLPGWIEASKASVAEFSSAPSDRARLESELVETYRDILATAAGGRAYAYGRLGQSVYALADYSTSIRFRPATASPYYRRAWIELADARFGAAGRDLGSWLLLYAREHSPRLAGLPVDCRLRSYSMI